MRTNKKISIKYERPAITSLLKVTSKFGSNKKGKEMGIEELLAATKV